MLDGLYQQAVVIAKQITKKENDDEAVLEFRKHLNSSEMYFNEHPFPKNESNEEAFRKCKSEKGANVLISALRSNYVNTVVLSMVPLASRSLPVAHSSRSFKCGGCHYIEKATTENKKRDPKINCFKQLQMLGMFLNFAQRKPGDNGLGSDVTPVTKRSVSLTSCEL